MSGNFIRALLAFTALSAPVAAWAGPPFLTDDPEPTETGHWEIYGPILEGEGRGSEFQGATGVEINFGAAPNLQLTLGLPVGFSRDRVGWRRGTGDIEISAKYRFYHDEDAGISIAFFPGMTLPTAGNGMGNHKPTGLLPIWVQKDMGAWSIFGGGGYAINSGTGNRDYWTGGAAIARQVTPRLLIGAEADRQGADAVGGRASTSLGLGAIYQLRVPLRLLASGGPTFTDGGGAAGYHAFLALGLDF
jgi:hypothetical protein